MYRTPFVVVAIFLLAGSVAQSQPSSSTRYTTMEAALDALKHAGNETEKAQIYRDIGKLPIETPDQLLALYDEVASMESRVTTADQRQYADTTRYLSQAFSTATDPKFSAALATALKKEYAAMPKDFIGPYGAKEDADIVRYEMRRARLQALCEAAGKAKDREALPTLRKMVESKGIARDYAVSAIGQIGDPADLENFIQKIERDPKARINLNSFGPAAVDRVVQEVEKPTVSPYAKGVLTNGLRYMATHDNIPRYQELLKNQNHVVREMAADGICRAAKAGDEEAVIEVARDYTNMNQFAAFESMDRNWSPKFVPVLREILVRAPSPIVRAEAAMVLGRHSVHEAVPDLQKARNDRDGEVRRAAEAALKKME